MGVIASQITSLTIVYSTVYSDADLRKHHSSASLAFVRGIHRRPVNSPHKWPVTRKMFSFDDVIMSLSFFLYELWSHNNSLLFCLQFKCGMSAKTILTNVLVSGIIFHYRLYYWLNWKARAEANVKYAVCGINRVWQQNRPTKIKFWCRFQFQMTKISPNA